MDSDTKEIMKKGVSFLEDAKYEEALGCFEKILVSNPNDPDILNKKGVALRSLGRYDEAIESFNKALEITPRDLDAS
ncbi:MAG: tetratricopeptide repeat protein [Thaumarchaeota archaeon]|nr:tetratricopeptide repeat protein [Nitrososphaerota archaeon]MBI3639163.1 tetratricopeptide repeat protein [Nitrososphaerota archaeon]